MSKESTKAMYRRMHDPAFQRFYFAGEGLDIGPGDDSISKQRHVFPRIDSVRDFDMQHGDGMTLGTIMPHTFDFVHSSHSLEHMAEPTAALRRWIDVTKPAGYIIVLVPDFKLYEHEEWPSKFNSDHKHAFSMSFYDDIAVTHVPSLIVGLNDVAHPIKMELLRSTFHFMEHRDVDQTLGIGECAIEIILQKNFQPLF